MLTCPDQLLECGVGLVEKRGLWVELQSTTAAECKRVTAENKEKSMD